MTAYKQHIFFLAFHHSSRTKSAMHRKKKKKTEPGQDRIEEPMHKIETENRPTMFKLVRSLECKKFLIFQKFWIENVSFKF